MHPNVLIQHCSLLEEVLYCRPTGTVVILLRDTVQTELERKAMTGNREVQYC